jgi:paraquat-inducible protein A
LAICTRCGATFRQDTAGRAAQRCAAAALVALILFFPAVLLPILEVEKLGHHHSASLLWGTIELLLEGAWFVGGVVLVFSIVFPLAKILLLLELSLLGLLHRRHKAITYRIMELVGRWSMMDVMLLAFLVMLVKLGNLVEFHVGPAVLAFVLCVAASMLASMYFDPHAIWEDDRAAG